jgi:hypothetical protein
MLKQISLFILFIVSFNTAVMAQTATLKTYLDQYQWENRIVLILAPDSTNEYHQKQTAEFTGSEDGFADRDLITFHLFTGHQSYLGADTVSVARRNQFYDYFDIKKGGFAVILLGKGGTEKLRTLSVLKTSKLFSTIDAMPMRQREMKQQQ